ncbi:hypothetical protein B0J11DRAFT_318241 [Dendryphion nanum]|uniref:Uncharacterized protein n=1 Tax=Dendryphion nanum TaxID=256645 RepID=A0A9P9DRB2_9PLEO|nr:hypothetical protein B0J11DRAFT_318241 [Dendryphion nanum]
MAVGTFFSALAGLLVVASLAVYFFGIPPELKRKLERQALKTMGENKLSYVAKDQIEKIPASDQEDVKQLKKGLGNTFGGVVKNPVGDAGGEFADTLTSPLTGR